MKRIVLPRKCRCRSNPNGLQVRRGGEIAGWLLSGATLVMIPKCPAFYTFKDPVGGTAEVGDDTNPNNRFIVDESGKMVRAGEQFGAKSKYVAGSNFEVSLVENVTMRQD